jgi:hypothetical protein
MKPRLTRRQREQKAKIEAQPVAWCLRQITREHGSVEGSSTRWLELLNDHAPDHLKRSSAWPTTPNQTGVIFGELSEGLKLLGIVLSFRRSNGVRLWHCETAEIAMQRRHFDIQRDEYKTAKIVREREDKTLLKQVRAQHRVLDSQRKRKTR